MTRALSGAGADVVVHHLDQHDDAAQLVDDVNRAGRQAFAVAADIAQRDAVTDMFQRATAALGPIDIVVNNAGVMTEQPFLDEAESWYHTIAVNLHGTYHVCQEALRHMTTAGTGVIINVASQLAFKGAAGLASYCASKGGIVGLTRALAREYGPAIRVYAVAPGPVATPLTAPYADEEWVEARTSGLVLGRLGAPDEVAAVVTFLATEESALLQGQTLHCNGGGVLA